MQLAVVVVSAYEADFLRVTLPRTRRALPDAKIFVVAPIDDGESQAISTALRAQSLTVNKDVLTAKDAKFNYAGILRTAQDHILSNLKTPTWVIYTRAQVCLDASLASIDLTTLDQDAVYGCGMKEFVNTAGVMSYTTAEEPSAEEVRSLVPDSQFLLAFAGGVKFDTWSMATGDAINRFLSYFASKYMIQKKLAHLGPLNADIDGRVSPRWGDPRSKVRIAPVHPATTDRKTDEKPVPKEAEAEAPKASAEQKEDAPKAQGNGDAKPESKPAEKVENKPEEKPLSDSLPPASQPTQAKPSPRPQNDSIRTENVTEQARPVPKSWTSNKYARVISKFDIDDDEPVSTKEASTLDATHARKEADGQQNVALATVSASEAADSVQTVAPRPFGRQRFAENPWKTVKNS